MQERKKRKRTKGLTGAGTRSSQRARGFTDPKKLARALNSLEERLLAVVQELENIASSITALPLTTIANWERSYIARQVAACAAGPRLARVLLLGQEP